MMALRRTTAITHLHPPLPARPNAMEILVQLKRRHRRKQTMRIETVNVTAAQAARIPAPTNPFSPKVHPTLTTASPTTVNGAPRATTVP